MRDFRKIVYTKTNEEDKIDLHLGGGSLLILALIASICLAVLPQNLTNKYGNNAVTTLADGDQIVWKTVYLNGTHAENKAKLRALTADDPYVKIVMQTDWVCSEYIGVNTKHKVLIWDLNGHSLTYSGQVSTIISGNVETMELIDSSAAGNGYIQGYSSSCGTFEFKGKNFILSGGTLKGMVNMHNVNFIMTGGAVVNWGNAAYPTFFNIDKSIVPTFYLAPWIKKTNITIALTQYSNGTEFNLTTEANTSQATYALSQSDSYCGAYNTAYGVAWNLAAGDCILGNIKHAVPHYLWYRDNQSEWYQMLLAL